MDIVSLLRDHGVDIGTVKKGGGGGTGNAYASVHTLPTTVENQKTWNVPVDVYDAETDTMMLHHNTGILDKASWTLTGNAATGYKVNIPDNPETSIEDNNVIIVILRNLPSTPYGEKISGTRLTEGSVAMAKLGQEVQDAINNAGSNIEIVNNFTTGGADKAASAETVKTLNTNQEQHNGKIATGTTLGHIKGSNTLTIDPDGTAHAKQVEIVNNTTEGGATKAASAETVKVLQSEVDGTKSTINTHKPNWDAGYNAYTRFQGVCSVITDWNLTTLNGMYMGNNVLNAPTTDWYMGIVIVHNDLYLVQKVIGVTNGREYERRKNNGVWEDWIETSPRQLFQSVSDGKRNLATAITGKGVTTSADDTFATMVANINAIPAGLKYYEITLSGNTAQKKFYSVSGSLITSDFNFITVTIPFNPALVHVRSIRTGDYFVESYYTSFSDGFTTGTVKMARYNGLQANDSNFNMRPFTTDLGNGSWSYEIPVLQYNTTYTIRAYG